MNVEYSEYGHGVAVPVYTSRVPAGHAAAVHCPAADTVMVIAASHTAADGPPCACTYCALHGQIDAPHGSIAMETIVFSVGLTHVMFVMSTAALCSSDSRPQHDCGSANGAAAVDSVLSVSHAIEPHSCIMTHIHTLLSAAA